VCRRPRGRVVAFRSVAAGARRGEKRIDVGVFVFTSEDVSYYDHFDWLYEVDWYQPR
jgi:hypothetical protein